MTTIRTIIYPVNDLARSRALYETLFGIAPYVDEAYYVGFRLDGQEAGLDPRGHRDGPVGYWHVEDIHGTADRLRQAGAMEHEAIRDVGGGRLIGTFRDADGNLIGLLQNPA